MRYKAAVKFGIHSDSSILPANPAKDQKDLITKTTDWARKHPNPCNPFRKRPKQ